MHTFVDLVSAEISLADILGHTSNTSVSWSHRQQVQHMKELEGRGELLWSGRG